MLAATITSLRIGFPLNVILLRQRRLKFFSVRNPVAIAVTRGASSRLARPITPFCSCSTVGTSRMLAAISGGTLG